MLGPMPKKATHQVITANFTDDGAVAYLRADRSWARTLAEAAVVDSPSVVEELLRVASVDERTVCDPYAMSVAVEDGKVRPLSARERIRRDGPTTRLRRPDPSP